MKLHVLHACEGGLLSPKPLGGTTLHKEAAHGVTICCDWRPLDGDKMKQIIKRIPIFYNLVHLVRCLLYRMRFTQRSLRRSYRFWWKVKTSSPLRIVIGASGVFDNGWIPSEIQYLNLLRPEHWTRFFSRSSVDAMLAEHVWEFLTTDEGLDAARQCFQYLKPGGYLRVAVPDGYHPDPAYIEWVKAGGNLSGDDHKVLYNYKSLRKLFEVAGFKVELLEYFDEHGGFHYREWDDKSGKIHRSRRFDERNKDGRLNYTSIILDARKEGVTHRGCQSAISAAPQSGR